jgi:chemotaxis protein MotB
MGRRRQREEEPENNDRWLVSYADFITLMFAFFTILFATSEQNVDKAKQFQDSLRVHLIKFGAMGDSGEKLNQGTEYNSPIDQQIKPFPQGSQELQKVQKKIERYLQSQLSSQQLEKIIKDIGPDAYGVRITLAGDSLFNRGGVQMKTDSLSALDTIARAIKETNRRVIIEGHSNDTPFAKELYPTSWELSSMQATKVLRYFNKVHKIEFSKMAAMTMGDQSPNTPYERRIDLLIITEDLPY